MDTHLLLSVALVLLLLVVAGALLTRPARTQHLAHRFGPAYERAKEPPRDPLPGIAPLRPHEAQRFRMDWEELQERFSVSPRTAVAEADLLVRELLARRGFPVAVLETRAADLARHYPAVVEHYRAAHAIALRDRTGEVGMESLRQAVAHYRSLFAELLHGQERSGFRR